MQRRSFLKLGTLAAAALAARLPFPWEAAAAAAKSISYGGLLYRAGGGGKVLVSADGGALWKLHTDLGDMYSIGGLTVDRKSGLRISVGYAGRSFTLYMAPDYMRWRTTA